MVALTDIAPSTRTIPVGGDFVEVEGISALGIAALLRTFPHLKDAFTSGELKFDARSLIAFGPDVVAAVIAAGCGSPGDPVAVKAAAKLPVAKQLDFLNAIVELTMPDGVGSFIEALNSIIARLDFGSHGKAPDSN